MKELAVVDLFSGIGGFSVGLHNASPMFKTVAFAEIDQFCQKVLKKNFGDIPIFEDIRDVRIEPPVFLVCGGFPCQGFSHAGLQRGTKDNRYLWPEMFDVIKHTKPRWVIAENVRGIVNVEDGMAFNKVHTDLESEGYEVQAFNIPAASKGAWHRRERIWFIACNPDVVYPYDFRCEQHKEAKEKGNGRAEATLMPGSSYVSDSESIGHGRGSGQERGTEQRQLQQKEQKRNEMGSETEGRSELPRGERNVSDSKVEGLEGHDEHRSPVSGKDEKSHTRNESGGKEIEDATDTECIGHTEVQTQGKHTSGKVSTGNGKERGTSDVWYSQGTGYESRINGQGQEEHGGASPPGEQCQGDWGEIITQFRGVPNGVSTRLDKTRTNRLKSLGNAIVPQIAEEIGRAIIKAELGHE